MKIRIGTRASQLALTQSETVAQKLTELGQIETELLRITTQGDRKQGTAAASGGDKRDWIHELEMGVVQGEFELAVHSGKDVPAEIASETILVPVLQRANPFDAFVGQQNVSLGRRLAFNEVPPGATIGTASLRRRAQLMRLRPDLQIVDHRGNVPTRLQKLDDNKGLAGIVLAFAGLARLGLASVGSDLPRTDILPAVNQGILAAQLRRDNTALLAALQKIQDQETVAAFNAERACVTVLNGDCNSCICVFAEVQGNQIKLSGRVLLPDGTRSIEVSRSAEVQAAEHLGRRVAQELIDLGALEILEQSAKMNAPRRAAHN
ncbi:MAG: hydroxymethylbilane synthase [Oligoflexia bacterium]|nr:hydroxymethylbilane synthase [Oligoflexia bacterium]